MVTFSKIKLNNIDKVKKIIIISLSENSKLSSFTKELNTLTGGVIERVLRSSTFTEQKLNSCLTINFPEGLCSDAIIIMKIDKSMTTEKAREAGANLSKILGQRDAIAFFNENPSTFEIIFGFLLREYRFDKHKSKAEEKNIYLDILVKSSVNSRKIFTEYKNILDGVFLTRDLTNEPSNILTTSAFAKTITQLTKFGLKVRSLEEKDLRKLGMNALLGVGQGSPSPSKVMIIGWKGSKSKRPLAIVGKGVVFDTGGISLKSPSGMEQMTVDMGGAGVVVGLMKTLALRKAKSNIVGLVGLVENMPDGEAQRPGDVVKSMKGDTIEVINTDAEGRLVLCDVLWYAQKTYNPIGLIDLATLTGAIIVALGHEKAGVFSNNDDLYAKFINSANKETEGAWRMPLNENYDKLLKSNIADMKNVGGRAANAITAAQFLERFVEKDMPWIHLDIAGVASTGSDSTLSPKGASGWGVRTLNRLIKDYF
jgi:leucyl aminopeptidase